MGCRMVKMGNVWERTVEVLNGRGGMLAGIAIPTIFVPGAIGAAWKAFVPVTPGNAVIGLVVTFVATLVTIWGQLAIIAASSDPMTDRRAAFAQANARFGPALLVGLVLAVVLVVAYLPPFVLLAIAGMNFAALGADVPQPAIAPGYALVAGLYILVLAIVTLLLVVRLVPLYAVVLHERRGVAAIARSWRLTRRHSWRLIGVVLLFVIVLAVASTAAQSVVGLIARLALGADARGTVAFIAALAGQAVSTALTLAAIVFSAQLYLALVTRERLLAERAAQQAAIA